MVEITHPCPGAFEFKSRLLTVTRVGCIAIVCVRWFHVLKVGRRLLFCRGKYKA